MIRRTTIGHKKWDRKWIRWSWLRISKGFLVFQWISPKWTRSSYRYLKMNRVIKSSIPNIKIDLQRSNKLTQFLLSKANKLFPQLSLIEGLTSFHSRLVINRLNPLKVGRKKWRKRVDYCRRNSWTTMRIKAKNNLFLNSLFSIIKNNNSQNRFRIKIKMYQNHKKKV